MKQIQSAVNPTAQPLVEVRKNQTVTSSLQIAEHFNKNHFDVLRDIRNLECSKGFQDRNFACSFYTNNLPNGGHKKLPMYYITRDGFTFLAMGFTGKEASRFKETYINAFNQMEQRLREIERKGHEKSFVSVKLLDEQRQQTNYWREIANTSINSMLNMSKSIVELSKNRPPVVES